MLELLTSACINYDFDGYVLEMLIHPQLANAIQCKPMGKCTRSSGG